MITKEKRRKGFVVTFLVAIALFFLPTLTLATELESVPNDSIETATPIDLNDWYYGNVDGKTNQYYRLILPSDGKVEVLFNNDGGNSDPSIYVRNKDEQYYLSFEGRSDLVGDEKRTIGLPKGDYYIQVIDTNRNSNYDFKLKVNFTAGDYFEKEFNNDFYAANPITIGKEYSGNFSYRDDMDYYKINLKSPGNFTACINTDGANSSDNIYIHHRW